MAIDQLADTRFEPAAADGPDLEAEAAQHSADAALEVEQLALHQLASGEQRPHLLRARGLGVPRAIPAKTEQLGNAASIAPVGLHGHRRQCRLHMAGLHEHRLEAGAAGNAWIADGDPARGLHQGQ